MTKKILTYGAGLIALYLVVQNYMGAGTVLTKGSSATVGIIKGLQGR